MEVGGEQEEEEVAVVVKVKGGGKEGEKERDARRWSPDIVFAGWLFAPASCDQPRLWTELRSAEGDDTGQQVCSAATAQPRWMQQSS